MVRGASRPRMATEPHECPHVFQDAGASPIRKKLSRGGRDEVVCLALPRMHRPEERLLAHEPGAGRLAEMSDDDRGRQLSPTPRMPIPGILSGAVAR